MSKRERELGLQKQWFEAKLAAEKQKMEVIAYAKEGKGDFVLVDARDRASYDQEHLPGAISMPPEGVEANYGNLDLAKEYVTYCWTST